MVGTKAFYDLQAQFEKDTKEVIYGHMIERVGRDEIVPKGIFYHDGYVNTLFQMYMRGYQHGLNA